MRLRDVILGSLCLCGAMGKDVAGDQAALPFNLTLPFNFGREMYWIANPKELLEGQFTLKQLGQGVSNTPFATTVFGAGKLGVGWKTCYTNRWFPEAISASFECMPDHKMSEGTPIEATLALPVPMVMFYGVDRAAMACSGTYVTTGIITYVRQQYNISWNSQWEVLITDTHPLFDLSHPLIRVERTMSDLSRNTNQRMETRRYRINASVVAQYLDRIQKNNKSSILDVVVLKGDHVSGVRHVLTALGYDVTSAMKGIDEKMILLI